MMVQEIIKISSIYCNRPPLIVDCQSEMTKIPPITI